MILHDATSGTFVHGVSLFYVAPLPPLWHRDLFVVDAVATIFCSYLGTAVFVAPLPSWQHRDSFVVDALATKLPAFSSPCWNRSL